MHKVYRVCPNCKRTIAKRILTKDNKLTFSKCNITFTVNKKFEVTLLKG